MRQLAAIVQTSLDGFVSGPKGEFDHFVGGEENLAFVCDITESADVAMMGRVSYELLQADWPTAGSKPGATSNIKRYSQWYNAASKVVFSKTLGPTPGVLVLPAVEAAALTQLKQQPGKDILVFGSPSIVNALLRVQMLDHLWLIVHPVIFGGGTPLFTGNGPVQRFTLRTSHQLSNGTLCNQYAVGS